MPEIESESLHYRHDRKHDSNGGCSLGAYPSDVERVNDVVDARHEHADNGRHGHSENDLAHWRSRQKYVVVSLRWHFHLMLDCKYKK